ncbi:MAG: molybdenum ABC transporter ATP-binding protein [Polaromonas sp.]|uniref:molybdenum ABC transporter ATP-binding protein n=1 Tax=Polaromonas sp. TaxID=1869339 RepID=UPI0027355AF8|nr:molybdenum ABC transporter ATP-binding protein [Polaromonas sp.]MDP2818077.1 molybdenum ABC transporter ATP-binding protein [Polaromonas sp.]
MSGIEGAFSQAFDGFLLEVSFSLPARGVTAFFGPSGSGKTTLLRCIAGLERVDRGRLVVNGEVWQDDAARIFMPVHRRPLGFVFQEASLFAHLDVRRNLDYGLGRVPAARRRVALEQAVELLGIGLLMQRRPDTLSGGERQRVAIARALATSPSLLLMDEPLAALDLQRKADVMPYLEKLHTELDIPILYVSHAPDEVARLADHLVLLEAGRISAAGPARELMTRLDLPLAHGDAAAAVIDATVTHLEPAWQLSHLAFLGGQISLPSQALQPGQRVRLRIQARDVSLSLQPQQGSSVLNVFAATVTGLADDSPGQLMVSLNAGGSTLLARITRKSGAALELQRGSRVYAQVKGVAVLG